MVEIVTYYCLPTKCLAHYITSKLKQPMNLLLTCTFKIILDHFVHYLPCSWYHEDFWISLHRMWMSSNFASIYGLTLIIIGWSIWLGDVCWYSQTTRGYCFTCFLLWFKLKISFLLLPQLVYHNWPVYAIGAGGKVSLLCKNIFFMWSSMGFHVWGLIIPFKKKKESCHSSTLILRWSITNIAKDP